MTSRRSRISSAIACAFLLSLVGAGVASSCEPGALIQTTTGDSGPSGTEVTVRATHTSTYSTNPDPVQIRWGSPTGQVLATHAGPDFETVVTIPPAPEGTYSIYATGGTGSYEPRTTFEVTPSPAPVADSAGPSPASGAQSPAAAGSASGSPAPASPSRPTPARDRQPAQIHIPTTVPASSKARPKRSDGQPGRRGGTAHRAAPAPAAPAVANRGVARDATPAFSHASATSAGSATKAGGQRSERVLAERWGGDPAQRVRSDATGTARTDKGSSFSPSATDRDRVGSGPGSGPSAIGIGLMGLALTALLAGFLTAEVRRRKAQHNATRD